MAMLNIVTVLSLLLFAVFPKIGGRGIRPEYNFTFVSRDGWGAVRSTDNTTLNTPVSYVVIHHTYLPGACYDHAQCSEAMQSMQQYHLTMDWGDIGYNFCVGSDGAVYEGRGWEKKGIHTGRANGVSVGICLIGDWRVKLPPTQQLETTKSLIAAGISLGYIKPLYHVVTHNQVMSTECPGAALQNYVTTWDRYSPTYPAADETK